MPPDRRLPSRPHRHPLGRENKPSRHSRNQSETRFAECGSRGGGRTPRNHPPTHSAMFSPTSDLGSLSYYTIYPHSMVRTAQGERFNGMWTSEHRRAQIAELLVKEYPTLFAAGIINIEEVYARVMERHAVEACIDGMRPELLKKTVEGAKKELGGGVKVSEALLRRWVRKILESTIKKVLDTSAGEKAWRATLRQVLSFITAPIQEEGRWSKERMRWKVLVAVRARDTREPPYPHPYIRHIRLKHDGLGKIGDRWLRHRKSTWKKKQNEMGLRALKGFGSPLRREIKAESGDDPEGSSSPTTMKGSDGSMSPEVVAWEVGMEIDEEEGDAIEVAEMLYVVKGEVVKGEVEGHISNGQETKVTIVEVEAEEAEGKSWQPMKSVRWSWGERWV